MIIEHDNTYKFRKYGSKTIQIFLNWYESIKIVTFVKLPKYIG